MKSVTSPCLNLLEDVYLDPAWPEHHAVPASYSGDPYAHEEVKITSKIEHSPSKHRGAASGPLLLEPTRRCLLESCMAGASGSPCWLQQLLGGVEAMTGPALYGKYYYCHSYRRYCPCSGGCSAALSCTAAMFMHKIPRPLCVSVFLRVTCFAVMQYGDISSGAAVFMADILRPCTLRGPAHLTASHGRLGQHHVAEHCIFRTTYLSAS